MAEETSATDRTEPASARRLEQAREEGQVARSQELTTFGVVAAGACGLWMTGQPVVEGLAQVFHDGLVISPEMAGNPALMLPQLGTLALRASLTVAPLVAFMFVAALAAPLALSGWVFSASLPVPDFSRLDPLSGITRVFSLRGFAELGKAVIKAVLVGGIGIWVVWHQQDALLSLSDMPFGGAMAAFGHAVGISLLSLAGALLVIAGIDVPYQLWQQAKRLRMTRDEVKREAKETDGDPHVRARIRSLQREAARKRMMAEVPKATVVVTNPTHYAVALAYREGAPGAPRVVAKGSHLLAARIREIAIENKVPLLEAPPLARALYRHVDLGMEIPETLYSAVAEVLVYVFQLRRYASYGGPAPRAPAPNGLPVPVGLDPGPGTA